MVNNRDDAQDILQEAFINVFRNIKSFRGDAALGVWIKTIVVRCALKKLKQHQHMESIGENGLDVAVDFPDGLEGEDLEALILSLPEGYRTVFLLIEVEGYSHREVSQMLEISEGTSKSQLSRAKKLLQKKLIKVDAL